jgi:hypothetical protein
MGAELQGASLEEFLVRINPLHFGRTFMAKKGTSRSSAKAASITLRTSTSKTAKRAAGSALTQSKAPKRDNFQIGCQGGVEIDAG